MKKYQPGITQIIFVVALLIFTGKSFSQELPIATVDIVKGKQVYEKEVMYFYEQNWKAFREEALLQKHISGYRLIKTKPDDTGHFTLILITQFPDSTAFKRVEENFRPIMKKLSPKGPRMLNDVKREQFLQFVAGYTGSLVFSKE